MRVQSSRPRAFVGVFTRLDGLRKSQGLVGRRHRGGHGSRGTPCPVLERGRGAPRGAGGLPRQGCRREAPRRRQGATRPPHTARVRRGDPVRQAPRRVRRARADGRARAASRGTTGPGASSRGRGARAPRAGGPPPPRARGHRGAARHLRQVGLRVADHVITLREFRGQAPLPDRQAYLRLREGPLPQHREGGECASPHRLPAPTCPCALGPGGRRSSVAAVRRRPWGQVCCEGARRGRERGPGRPRRPQGPGYDRKID